MTGPDRYLDYDPNDRGAAVIVWLTFALIGALIVAFVLAAIFLGPAR